MVVQFDEPSLPAALAGRLTGVTSLTPVHPVDESVGDRTAGRLRDDRRRRAWRYTAVRPDCPGRCLQRSSVSAVSVDASTLTAAELDGVGEFLDSGRTVMLGVVPTTPPDRTPSAEEVAKSVVAFTDRLGFARAVLPEQIGVTPACGLAGATLSVGAHRDRSHPERRPTPSPTILTRS